MKSFLKKRALSPSLFFLAVGALIHCGNNGPQTSFTTQGDTAVVAGIVGTWVGTSSHGVTFTMSLCENTGDTTSSASCATLHTVRGDDRGKTETVTEPEGCGGCDYDNSAYVVGTISGDDREYSAISGQFQLTGGDVNGLAMPYRIFLSSPDISMGGDMNAPATMTLDSSAFGSAPILALDASTVDADHDDASADDPNAVDASDANAPGDENEIVFHRIGDATCPTP